MMFEPCGHDPRWRREDHLRTDADDTKKDKRKQKMHAISATLHCMVSKSLNKTFE
jgi:hypothetical protein